MKVQVCNCCTDQHYWELRWHQLHVGRQYGWGSLMSIKILIIKPNTKLQKHIWQLWNFKDAISKEEKEISSNIWNYYYYQDISQGLHSVPKWRSRKQVFESSPLGLCIACTQDSSCDRYPLGLALTVLLRAKYVLAVFAMTWIDHKLSHKQKVIEQMSVQNSDFKLSPHISE